MVPARENGLPLSFCRILGSGWAVLHNGLFSSAAHEVQQPGNAQFTRVEDDASPSGLEDSLGLQLPSFSDAAVSGLPVHRTCFHIQPAHGLALSPRSSYVHVPWGLEKSDPPAAGTTGHHRHDEHPMLCLNTVRMYLSFYIFCHLPTTRKASNYRLRFRLENAGKLRLMTNVTKDG